MPGSRLEKKKKKKNKGSLYIILGALIIIAALFIKHRSNRVLSFSGEIIQASEPANKVPPTEIFIDSVGINLDVTEGVIENGVWQISNSGATHLNSSANPGEGGNIVIYGHNKSNLFGKLLRIKKGDIIKVKNETGTTFSYVTQETTTVVPTQIDFVMPRDIETLTLYTCTGFMDSKRFIVIAKPTT